MSSLLLSMRKIVNVNIAYVNYCTCSSFTSSQHVTGSHKSLGYRGYCHPSWLKENILRILHTFLSCSLHFTLLFFPLSVSVQLHGYIFCCAFEIHQLPLSWKVMDCLRGENEKRVLRTGLWKELWVKGCGKVGMPGRPREACLAGCWVGCLTPHLSSPPQAHTFTNTRKNSHKSALNHISKTHLCVLKV